MDCKVPMPAEVPALVTGWKPATGCRMYIDC